MTRPQSVLSRENSKISMQFKLEGPFVFCALHSKFDEMLDSAIGQFHRAKAYVPTRERDVARGREMLLKSSAIIYYFSCELVCANDTLSER